MALTSYATFEAALDDGRDIPFAIPSLATQSGRWYDLFTTAVPVGVAPTTPVAPTRTTAGALPFVNANAGAKLGVMGGDVFTTLPGIYILCDRLSHQGGLSGAVATSQVTNLPTAALTRFTSGVGVMAAITVYVAIGATAGTLSATYTNSSGTAAQVSPVVVLGGSGSRELGRMVLIPLAVGDVGVQSVQSIICTTPSATAGNMGVTLFKPLAALIVDSAAGISHCDFVTGSFGGGLPEIPDNACPFIVSTQAGAIVSSNTNCQGNGTLFVTEW
jgi:hypothetical protein